MEYYRSTAAQEWEKARSKAFWSNMLNILSPSHNELLSFDEISARLRLKSAIYRGRQNVLLDNIIGSVGRYHDFTREFLPKENIDEDRWKGVAAAFLNPGGRGVPPIELFKIGNNYFVKDGNHRVSVARQLGLVDIEAYIWEFPLPHNDIDLTNIDEYLLETEREEFLNETQLDKLRPHHNIRITVPGGYTELLYQIAHYQDVLCKIDETDVPYSDAVTAWYDMIYETSVQKIRTEGILDMFPGRTEADFFVWITRYHRELKAKYHRPVMLSQAVRDFRVKHTAGLWNGLRRTVNRLLGRKFDEPL